MLWSGLCRATPFQSPARSAPEDGSRSARQQVLSQMRSMQFLKSKPSIQLLIFDLDGTLIDSKLDLALCVKATLEHLGRPVLDDETIFSYVGQGAPTLIR